MSLLHDLAERDADTRRVCFIHEKFRLSSTHQDTTAIRTYHELATMIGTLYYGGSASLVTSSGSQRSHRHSDSLVVLFWGQPLPLACCSRRGIGSLVLPKQQICILPIEDCQDYRQARYFVSQAVRGARVMKMSGYEWRFLGAYAGCVA
jgi:hypothetical protein